MKTALIIMSVLFIISLVGCGLFGMAFISANSDLSKAESEIIDLKASLTDIQSELADTQTQLVQAQSDLIFKEDELTALAQNLAETEARLKETELDLAETSVELASAIEKSTAAYTSYLSLREQINQKLGLDENGELIITPRSPTVTTLVKQIAGTLSPDWDEFWRDYKRMYDWVLNNIEYSSDTNLPILPEDPQGVLLWMSEYWKLPEETLEDRKGDCEDMSGLLASLLLSYNNEQYSVWMVVIRGSQGDGHVAVASPIQGDRLVFLDPAGRYYTGSPGGISTSYSISAAVNQWLLHWSLDIPGARITAVFSNDFYLEFDATGEFITWAENRY